MEEFQQKMSLYAEANLQDAEPSLADFFQDTAKKGILNLPIAGKDEEDMFESARIYIVKAGRPFNYLPTESEVAAEVLARRAEKEEAEVEQAAAKAQRASISDLEA